MVFCSCSAFSVCIAPLSELSLAFRTKMVQMSVFVYIRFGGGAAAAFAVALLLLLLQSFRQISRTNACGWLADFEHVMVCAMYVCSSSSTVRQFDLAVHFLFGG